MAATRHAALGEAERKLVRSALERLGLSMRAYDKVIRVALTIADLNGANRVEGEFLAEASPIRPANAQSPQASAGFEPVVALTEAGQ